MGEVVEFGKSLAPQASLNEPPALTPEEELDNGVGDVLASLMDVDIEKMLVITVEDGVLHLRANRLQEMEIIYMLECAKHEVLNREYE